MAVVLAVRAVLVLAPVGYRVVKLEQSATGQPGPRDLGVYLWGRLSDPGESDADLTALVEQRTGSMADVATYTGTFELRKLQVKWGRSSGAAAGTDDAVTTHHFLRLAAGAPSDAWVAADFLAVESAFNTFWGAIKSHWMPATVLKQYRWYKVGPSISPPQLPVRIVDGTTAGTSVERPAPPQVAISVTEKTTDAKSWGRFYLPHPAIGSQEINTSSRIPTTFQTSLADAADTMYQAFLTASTIGVVYSAAKASRVTKGGATLPAIAARALSVDQIQVDDVYDVIRSRRWNEPLLRIQRDIS